MTFIDDIIVSVDYALITNQVPNVTKKKPILFIISALKKKG